MSARRALERFVAPDELAAEDRAWAVVRSAYREHARAVQRRSPRRLAFAFVVTLALGVVVLSPAGATVGRLITRALGIRNASPALSSLPAPGRLLVSDRSGTWTVAADGALRRLGPWPDASWSPHGRFVAVAAGRELAAIDTHGTTQWALSRPRVSEPRWVSPSGYRVAYLSAGDLRVVAGDGTGDHLVASHVASVAPAWRPGHSYQLAYLSRGGTVVVRDGETERALWSRRAGTGMTSLEWSANGRYLLALSPTAARLYSAAGAVVADVPLARVLDGALSPDGRTLALVLGGATDEVVLDDLLARGAAPRRVLPGAGLGQVVWSPDGRWLLVSWPTADQWVFIRVKGTPRIAAVSHIAQQFAGSGPFPQLDSWCCTAR